MVIEIMKDIQGYLTEEEQISILNVDLKARDKLMIFTLLNTGRRVSEVVGKNGVRPCDIFKDNNYIRWKIEKKRTGIYEKAIPTDSEVIIKLLDYCKENMIPEEEPIFKFTRQRAFQIVRKAGELAGITIIGSKKIHPHNFRHTFGINKAKKLNGINELRILKDLMAHSSIDATAFYLTYSDKRVREIVEH